MVVPVELWWGVFKVYVVGALESGCTVENWSFDIYCGWVMFKCCEISIGLKWDMNLKISLSTKL
uniref:Uncharacterized protein n=1 Tax=Arundo donax TaxID=35708 RepID=A0A0A8Y8E9_ARUDO